MSAQLATRLAELASAGTAGALLKAASIEPALTEQVIAHVSNLGLKAGVLGAARTASLLHDLATHIARELSPAERATLADAERLQTKAVMLALDARVDEANAALEDYIAVLTNLGQPVIGARQLQVRLLLTGDRRRAGFSAALAMLDAFEQQATEDLVQQSAMWLYERARELVALPPTEDAAVFFARAVRWLEQHGQPEPANCVAVCLARTLVTLDEPEDAIFILNERLGDLGRYAVVQAGAAAPSPTAEPLEARYALARAMARIGRTGEAERIYRAHPWFSSDHDLAERAELRCRLAALLIESEHYAGALACLQPQPPTRPDDLQSGHAALGLALLAKTHVLLGHPDSSHAPAAEARERLAGPPSELCAAARIVLVERALLLGESAPDLAVELDIAAAELQRLNLPPPATLDRTRSDLCLAQGHGAEALRYIERALETALQPAEPGPWHTHWHQGFEAFERKLQAAQSRAVRAEHGVGLDLEIRLARALRHEGADPLPALERVVSVSRRRGRLAIRFDALMEQADVFSSRDDSTSATRCLQEAADTLEDMRARLRDLDTQIRAMAGREVVYERLLAQYATVPEHHLDGLRVMERCKSRGLLELLWQAIESGPAGPPRHDDAVHLARRQLLREIRQSLLEGLDAARAEHIHRLKETLASTLRRQQETSPPSPRAAMGPEDVLAFSRSQGTILHYFCGIERSFAAVIAGNELRTFEPLPEVTQASIGELLDTLDFELSTREQPRSLEELHRLLLAPIEPALAGCERLLIIAHGPLHAVPFAALRDRCGTSSLAHCDVAHAWSTGVAEICARRQSEPRRGACAGIGVTRTPYLPLPALDGIDAELAALGEQFAEAHLLHDEKAIRRELFALGTELSVMHFACHAEFDDVDPLLSRLYLQDGPLYAYELAGMGCRADLVVLSACQTGVQLRRAGDEMFGLIRPFLGMGAASVLAAHWRISDEATARLMRAFYHHWHTTGDAARSLRLAQQVLKETPDTAHPYFWAGFFVMGALKSEAPADSGAAVMPTPATAGVTPGHEPASESAAGGAAPMTPVEPGGPEDDGRPDASPRDRTEAYLREVGLGDALPLGDPRRNERCTVWSTRLRAPTGDAELEVHVYPIAERPETLVDFEAQLGAIERWTEGDEDWVHAPQLVEHARYQGLGIVVLSAARDFEDIERHRRTRRGEVITPWSYHRQLDRILGGDRLHEMHGQLLKATLMPVARATELAELVENFVDGYQQGPWALDMPFAKPLAVLRLNEIPVIRDGHEVSISVEELFEIETLRHAPEAYRDLALVQWVYPGTAPLTDPPKAFDESTLRQLAGQLFDAIRYGHEWGLAFNRNMGCCVRPEFVTREGGLSDLYFLTAPADIDAGQRDHLERIDLVNGLQVLQFVSQGSDNGTDALTIELESAAHGYLGAPGERADLRDLARSVASEASRGPVVYEVQQCLVVFCDELLAIRRA